MRQRELKKLKAMLAKLTFGQRQEFMNELSAEGEAAASVGLIEAHGKPGHCPH